MFFKFLLGVGGGRSSSPGGGETTSGRSGPLGGTFVGAGVIASSALATFRKSLKLS